jgi:hypothetical protein
VQTIVIIRSRGVTWVVRGGLVFAYSPKSIAHMPVPVPTSRTHAGLSIGA